MEKKFDYEAIDAFFPMDDYRKGQKESIQKILEAFESGKKFILLEAPTGSGKSAIAFAVSQFFESSYYLAPQIFLQDQLTADFGETGKHIGLLEPMIDLKGRNTYPCNYYERMLFDPDSKLTEKQISKYKFLRDQEPGCDTGHCKRKQKSKLPYCNGHCPYFNRLEQAIEARLCLMNFQAFLFQTSVVRRFEPRNLLILDECHTIEDALMNFIEISLSDRDIGMKFEKFETASEYKTFFEEIKLADIITNNISVAMANLNSQEEEKWKQMLLRYKIFRNSDADNWVPQFEEKDKASNRRLSLKPVFVDEFLHSYVFNKADHILMMSATILSKRIFCQALGVDQESASSLRMPSSFHPKARPIYYRPSGSMSYKNKANTMSKMVKDVQEICQFHENEKGIIHTHSFDIHDAILNGGFLRDRLLSQRDPAFRNNKFALLEKHKESKNTIILAPAMHEGLDLKDDLGRFQIICKVPYPSKGDPQIAARLELSGEYYNWKTATKLIQSCGRICRHNEDYGITYVMDSDFKRFIERNSELIPEWFAKSIVWD
jgi:Rad3-related DNA helicase